MWVFLYGGYNDLKLNWLRQPDIKASVESEKEVRISKEHNSIVIITIEGQDDLDLIRHKPDLHKSLRILSLILRFLNNCIKRKKSGSLTTVQLVNQKKFYIKREQEK